MTVTEQDACVGRLVRDLADARRELQCLGILAEERADAVYRVGEALQTAETEEVTVEVVEGGLVIKREGHQPRHIQYPDVQAVAALVNDVRAARQRVERLEARRKKLGIDV